MDLNTILEKNKKRISKVSTLSRLSPSIATEDRPYVIDFETNKTDNKEETIRKQTGNKQVFKEETNGKQTGNTVADKNILKRQRDNKEVTEQVTIDPLIRKQTSNKEVTEQVTTVPLLSMLVGIQKDIILFLYFQTKKTVSYSTIPISLDYISNALNLKKTIIKTTIIRLQKKQLISRFQAKTGRGGWTVYQLNPSIYKELMQQDNFGYLENKTGNKEVTNGKQTDNKVEIKQVTQQVTGVHSSSSDQYNNYNLISNTTNYSADAVQPKFIIDIESLVNIGLTQNHVAQILKLGKFTPEQLQESIEHFAFDLEYNDKAKTFKSSPLEVFVGILRKGNYYNAPSNYESKKALNLRLSLEARVKQEQVEKELEDKLKEMEWKGWSEKLTEQQLLEFYVEDKPLEGIPEKVQKTLKRRNALTNAEEYFESEVWPDRKQTILLELETQSSEDR